ncbi:MAG: hypothetical protein IPF54_17895 [Draconibacterium sp.]|nr:hypothetical protein [Draconibacterium sp.]
MKNKTLFKTAILLASIFVIINVDAKEVLKELNIKHIELGPPVPAIPFYHFIAEIDLPEPSIIEVQAEVNGKTLRATDLHRIKDEKEMDRPPISHRPPSGYGLSQDATLYKNMHVVGWVKWEPGKEYTIKISVRIKKNVKASENDVWLTKTETVKAPGNIAVFDPAWKNYKSVVVTETAGIARKTEPVEFFLPFILMRPSI